MLINNVNVWLLMIENNEILGEEPESVSVEFNTKEESALLTAKFKEGVATQSILIKDLEVLIEEEVSPNKDSWNRTY